MIYFYVTLIFIKIQFDIIDIKCQCFNLQRLLVADFKQIILRVRRTFSFNPTISYTVKSLM